MQETTFEGPLSGYQVVAGVHASTGGTNNFHFASAAPPPEPLSTVPFLPDPNFVERPEISEWVEAILTGPKPCAALVGFGGFGKSQIAMHYAHSVRRKAPGTWVFWVHASSVSRFKEAYQDIAERLKLPGREDPRQNVLQLVYRWLTDETKGPWLMVVDNADSSDTFFSIPPAGLSEGERPLASYIPKTGPGKVLVTSRSLEAGERLVGEDATYRVPVMEEYQAIRLLRGRLGEPLFQEGEIASGLLAALDYIPLAIIQAASYIKRRSSRGVTMETYLQDFLDSAEKRTKLLKFEARGLLLDPNASSAILTTSMITFDQVRHERVSAADLLSFMSFFNPGGIPKSMLEAYSDQIGYGDLEEDLDVLEDYSLVSTAIGEDDLEMHALVQLSTQVWLSLFDDKEEWRLEFLHCMASQYPFYTYKVRSTCQRLDPHLSSAIETQPTAESDVKQWVALLNNAAEYRAANGLYKRAENLQRKAIDASEKIYGREDIATCALYSNLGRTLRRLGNLQEAEKVHRRAVVGAQKALGNKHDVTLLRMSTLAMVIHDQGRVQEAEKMYRQILTNTDMLRDYEESLAVVCATHLSGALLQQGKYEEAKRMNLQILAESERVWDDYHPNRLTIFNNLMTILLDTGKYEEGEIMGRRVLMGRKRSLGDEHPHTLQSLGNLAALLTHRGEFEEAEQLYRQALAGHKKILGVDNTTTLGILDELAHTIRNRNNHEESEKLFRQLFASREKGLGSEHPDTAQAKSNVAIACWCLGKCSEAMELLRKSIPYLEDKQSPPHPPKRIWISILEQWESLANRRKSIDGGGPRDFTDNDGI